MVVWDRYNYLQEASRQLQDQNIYEDENAMKKFIFNENILTDQVAKSNKIFKRLCSHKLISEKELTILLTILRKLPISVNYIFCLRYTNV